MILQVILNALVLGSTIALMSVGMTLIFGILRVVNFWHGEAYMLGAVFVYWSMNNVGLGYVSASLFAIFAVGILGWVSDKLVFRRFRDNLMGGVIAAIAFSMGLQNICWLTFGARPKSLPPVVEGNLEIFGSYLAKERLLVIVVSIVAILGLAWLIKYTKLGKGMRAVQQDSEAALTMGVSVRNISALTFGLATALAALAGAIISPLFSINPAMGSTPLMVAFIVIIVGGMGSVMGAFIASYIIGLQMSFTSTFIGPHLAMGGAFAIGMLILFFREI